MLELETPKPIQSQANRIDIDPPTGATTDELMLGSWWEKQHADREKEHAAIASQPNAFAVECASYLQPKSRILEIGPANGRDTAFFVQALRATVFAMDISFEAIRQLRLHQAAIIEACPGMIIPILASAPNIPINGNLQLDALYARSSIYMSDSVLVGFLKHVRTALGKNGKIFMEGKMAQSEDLLNNVEIAPNLLMDKNGHIRRRWDGDSTRTILRAAGFEVVTIKNNVEVWQEQQKHFLQVVATV